MFAVFTPSLTEHAANPTLYKEQLFFHLEAARQTLLNWSQVSWLSLIHTLRSLVICAITKNKSAFYSRLSLALSMICYYSLISSNQLFTEWWLWKVCHWRRQAEAVQPTVSPGRKQTWIFSLANTLRSKRVYPVTLLFMENRGWEMFTQLTCTVWLYDRF